MTAKNKNDKTEPIDVGTRKQLFIDNRFVDEQKGVSLRMNPPAKAGPVLLPETEIESHRIGHPTVLEVDGGYVMYYHAIAKAFHSTAVRKHHQQEIRPYLACRAVSDDGLTWKRENVGLHDAFGNKDNNMVMPGCLGTYFLDPRKTDGCRFWWFGIMYARFSELWEQMEGAVYTWTPHEGGLYLCRSKDGVNWQRVRAPALPFLCDTFNQCFYDTRLEKYVAYIRGWDPKAKPGDYGRTVCRAESDSLLDVPWPFEANPNRAKGPNGGFYGTVEYELPTVIRADESDPPGTDIYNPSVCQYACAEDVYLSFPSPYRRYDGFDSHGRDPRGRYQNTGSVHIACAVSRDGSSWRRFSEPYVGLGTIGEIDAGSLYMGVGMVRKGNEMWQYYSGQPFSHCEGSLDHMPNAGIFRVVQRLDGFVSADVGAPGGEIITPVIKFTGSRLELNIDCGAMGEAWVELQEPSGKPIPGFAMSESVSVDRNGVAQEVWWQNGPDVSSLAGKPVRMRIRMRSAKLYAFQFVSGTGEIQDDSNADPDYSETTSKELRALRRDFGRR